MVDVDSDDTSGGVVSAWEEEERGVSRLEHKETKRRLSKLSGRQLGKAPNHASEGGVWVGEKVWMWWSRRRCGTVSSCRMDGDWAKRQLQGGPQE